MIKTFFQCSITEVFVSQFCDVMVNWNGHIYMCVYICITCAMCTMIAWKEGLKDHRRYDSRKASSVSASTEIWCLHYAF